MATRATRRRRGRGEGSLFYDQGRGEWVGIVDLGRDGRGRRHRKTVRDPKKEAAAEKLRAVQADRDRGLPSVDRTLTVEGWCSWWLDNIVAREVTPLTVRQYRSRLEQWVVPWVGRIPLVKLRPEQVVAMMGNLAEQGLSPQSIRQARGILVAALKQAEAWGKVPRNVAALTKAPAQTGTKLNDALDEADAAKVLGAARGDRLEALAVLVLATGLRQGEALALRWEDVNLDAGTVTVVKSKTPSGVRTIALPGSYRGDPPCGPTGGPSWPKAEATGCSPAPPARYSPPTRRTGGGSTSASGPGWAGGVFTPPGTPPRR